MRGLPAALRAVPAFVRGSVPAFFRGLAESPPSTRREAPTSASAQGTLTESRLSPQDLVEAQVSLEAGTEAGTLSAAAPETTARPGEAFMDLVAALPPDLLRRALTHSSWVGERTGSYERLEFLGDSVLGLAIASALYSRFPDREEGGLARLKAFVVSRASCVQVAERMGLVDLVLAHAPASERRRREAVRSRSMLGDVLEALIGAIYVHNGFERVRPAIIAAFEEQIQYAVTAHVDYKTALQELLAPRGAQPTYRLVEETGPAHARTFTSVVGIDGIIHGRGTGTTIKMSEQAAAQEALASLRGEGVPLPAVTVAAPEVGAGGGATSAPPVEQTAGGRVDE